MPRTCRGLLAAALLAATAARARSADPADLLKYAPGQANAVVIINNDAILSSARAVKEGWAKIEHTEFLAGAIPVNPRVERVILTKEIHLQAPAGGPTFAIAVAKQPIDIDRLVKTTGGQAITVGGEPAVATPNKSVLVPLDKQLLGIAWSDTRQNVACWLRAAKTATASPLGLHLNATVRNIGTRHHILIVLDTEELFDADRAGVAVALTKSLEGDQPQSALVQKFAAGLKGIVLSVDVTADGLAAMLRFDLTATTEKMKPEAFKGFVLDVLTRNGAATEDLQAAKPEVGSNWVALRFQLSDPELVRIMSLFLPPLPTLSADAIVVAPAGVTPAATKKYMLAVNRVLDDLKAQNKRARVYEKTAVWYEAAANRIETVSVLNVDKMAVEYGLGTVGRLRAVADSLRGVPVQLNLAESKLYASYYYQSSVYLGGRGRPGIFASPRVDTNMAQIQQQQAEIVEKDRENRNKLWEAIDRQRYEVRREMAEKYKIDTDTIKK